MFGDSRCWPRSQLAKCRRYVWRRSAPTWRAPGAARNVQSLVDELCATSPDSRRCGATNDVQGGHGDA